MNHEVLIPKGPFPGLRPYMDYESTIFYGRDRQVGEILKRLEQRHVVSVLGGSGSGKSSLVKAGVIPKLRQYGIKGTGHFWVPIVFTPGTNFKESKYGPYNNLTHSLIEPLNLEKIRAEHSLEGQSEQDVRDLVYRDILSMLRNPDGLSEYIETYSQYIDIEGLPSSSASNFLFVFDQFEEVFHASNENRSDVADFVESLLLGHYKNPNDRAHVVITMRSEYLNDCARFIDLPDLINESGYLVARLKLFEIKETIETPLKKYLRIVSRINREHVEDYPDNIVVDENVIKQILNKIQKLTNNPDHLPLLQHLLFRLWQVALARAKKQGDKLPARITEQDLLEAVGKQSEQGYRQDMFNSCLDHWSNQLFQSLVKNGIRPSKIEWFFVRMAYLDHNGKYSQQRISLDNIDQDIEQIIRAFTKPHSYLYKDKINNTIKVSHESFIRGWDKYVAWLKDEEKQLEQYDYVTKQIRKMQPGSSKLNFFNTFRHGLSSNELKAVKSSGLFTKKEKSKWFSSLNRGENEEDYIHSKYLLTRGYQSVDHSENVISVRDFIKKSKFLVNISRLPIIILIAGVSLIPWLLTLNFEKSYYDIYRNLTEIEKQIDLNGDWNTSAIVNYIPQILNENLKHDDIRKDPMLHSTILYDFSKFWKLSLGYVQSILWKFSPENAESRFWERNSGNAEPFAANKITDLLLITSENKYAIVERNVSGEAESNNYSANEKEIECQLLPQEDQNSRKITENTLSGTLITRPAADGNSKESAGIFITTTKFENRAGDYKIDYSVYSADLRENKCELKWASWDLSNFRPVMTKDEIKYIDDYHLFFNSDISMAYKVWSIDDQDDSAGSKRQIVYISEIPLTHPGDLTSVAPQQGMFYYRPYATGQRGKLIFEKHKFPDKSTFIQNDYSYLITSQLEPNGIRLDIADASIKKTAFSSPVESSSLSTENNWLVLKQDESVSGSGACRKMKKRKDFQSVLAQYRRQEKISYLANDEAGNDQAYCVISVNKSFDSNAVWDFYFFNENKIDELGYWPVVRNFRVSDVRSLFIGAESNEDWFAVTTSQGHSVRRPWNKVSLIKMVTDLCQSIDYHEDIDTGNLCANNLN